MLPACDSVVNSAHDNAGQFISNRATVYPFLPGGMMMAQFFNCLCGHPLTAHDLTDSQPADCLIVSCDCKQYCVADEPEMNRRIKEIEREDRVIEKEAELRLERERKLALQEEELKLKLTQFLAAFRNSGNMRFALTQAGMDREQFYYWHKTVPDFARQYEEAKADAIDSLELIARQRAMRSSDSLLMFLLKSMRPEVYREKIEVRMGAQQKARELAEEFGVSEEEAVRLVEEHLLNARQTE